MKTLSWIKEDAGDGVSNGSDKETHDVQKQDFQRRGNRRLSHWTDQPHQPDSSNLGRTNMINHHQAFEDHKQDSGYYPS